MTVVLDTSALSACMRRLPQALARMRGLAPDDLVLSSPVAAEIRFGLERLVAGSRRRRLLEAEYGRIRAVVRWADWTEAAAELFGVHKAALVARGQLVEDMDVAVASVALSLGAAVATANVRHFQRFEGLTVEDWGA